MYCPKILFVLESTYSLLIPSSYISARAAFRRELTNGFIMDIVLYSALLKMSSHCRDHLPPLFHAVNTFCAAVGPAVLSPRRDQDDSASQCEL